MKFTTFLSRIHRNTLDLQRFWAVDTPKVASVRKRLGKHALVRPVLPEHVQLLRKQLDNEYNVMRCLSSPYLSKEKEEAFHNKYGLPHENIEKAKEKSEYERMPNKPKIVRGNTKLDKREGNVGNLLHEHQTVERHFNFLMQQRRFE